jgi:hypothetical protein
VGDDFGRQPYERVQPPQAFEPNWIQTVPGKGWFSLLRLYGPLDPWFDKTWGSISAKSS